VAIITYNIDDYDTVRTQAEELGIVESVATNIVDGKPTECYFVTAEPPATSDETDLQAYFDGMTEVLDGE
jgi:hypothetical protein